MTICGYLVYDDGEYTRGTRVYSGSLSTGSPAGRLAHLKRASWLNVQSGHSKAGEMYQGPLGYPECANHLGRAVPELKGNTEKVARAVEK